jgi:hypothetical protein
LRDLNKNPRQFNAKEIVSITRAPSKSGFLLEHIETLVFNMLKNF